MATSNYKSCCIRWALPSCLPLILLLLQAATATPSIQFHQHSTCLLGTRGGAAIRRSSDDPFPLVAKVIQDRLSTEEEASERQLTLAEITDALEMLASSQQTFKGLDGAAHEAYQRTHQADDEDLLTVSGRARRSAARAGAAADGLGACELVELLELDDSETTAEIVNATLSHGNRQVLLNLTSTIPLNGKPRVSVLVLYEPIYNGGAGIFHGGIRDQERPSSKKGRLLVIVGDDLRMDLSQTLQTLDTPPKHIRLLSGLLSNEIASVQANLYKTAGAVLEAIEPTLREYGNSTSAVHFVGRSLGGGIAGLAALILDGSLPMPKSKKKTKPAMGGNGNETTIEPLSGLGKDIASAVTLGAPPYLSSNVQSECILSILYGDDIVCRATAASLDRLSKRSKRALQSSKWLGGKQLNFMTDALSLTVSSLKTHAHGSEGEELRLATPGRAFLLRPRKYGGFCSIHEVGNQLKGGREALRAQVLWQLEDILLSKSLWKHHQLDSYIHGLDKAHLRGFVDEEEDTFSNEM